MQGGEDSALHSTAAERTTQEPSWSNDVSSLGDTLDLPVWVPGQEGVPHLENSGDFPGQRELEE